MKKMVKRIIIIFLLAVGLCFEAKSQKISIDPTFVPLEFSYDLSTNKFDLVGKTSVNFKYFTLNFELTDNLLNKHSKNETVNVGRVEILKEDYVIVVRYPKEWGRKDEIYTFRNGEYYSSVTDGVYTENKPNSSIVQIHDNKGNFKLTLYDGAMKISKTEQSNNTTYDISDLAYKKGYYRVTADKTFFHKNEWSTMSGSRTNNYILKGQIVYIEKISNTNTTGYTEFTYNGITTKGWVIMKHLSPAN